MYKLNKNEQHYYHPDVDEDNADLPQTFPSNFSPTLDKTSHENLGEVSNFPNSSFNSINSILSFPYEKHSAASFHV